MPADNPTPEQAAESRIWFMRKVPLFEEQTESFYQSADLRAKHEKFRRGDVLSLDYKANKNIYILVDGQVKLRSVTENGKEIIIDLLGAGDAFGPIERVVGLEVPNMAPAEGSIATEAVALSEGSALKFSLEYFQDIVQRRPTVVFNLSRLLGTRQRRLEIRLRRLLYRTSLGKVAGLLSELAERYGKQEKDGIVITFRLRHHEMASIIGSKRETVTECLADLEYRELISTARNEITVLKLEELDRIP